MSVAFILNPGYNTINNVHHTFWDQEGNAIANSSLTQALEVSTSVAAPSHVITGGTLPAQLYMQPDGITLATDAPQFQAPILLAPTSKLQLVDEFEPTTGITFSKDIHMTYDATAHDIDGVGTLTCDTLKYTTLDPPVTPGDPSTWSQYPATHSIDTQGQVIVDTLYSEVRVGGPLIVREDTGPEPYVKIWSYSTDVDRHSYLDIQTGTGSNSVKLINNPDNITRTLAFNSLPAAAVLNVTSGAVAPSIVLDQAQSGNTFLTYANKVKALQLSQDGAVSFNTTKAAGNDNLTSDFGTAGQIIQSNGDAAPPSWVNAPSASNWSDYTAVSDVNMGLFNFANAGVITCYGTSSEVVNQPLLVSSQNTDPYHKVKITLETEGDGDTVPFVEAYITLNSLVSGPAPSSNWTDRYGAIAISPSDASYETVLAGNRVALTGVGSTSAFVRSSTGAVSFDSAYDGYGTTDNFGTAGQIVQSNGDSNPPSWVDATTASNWSQYDALNTVNMADNDISGIKNATMTNLYTTNIKSDIDCNSYTLSNVKTLSGPRTLFVAANLAVNGDGSVAFPFNNISDAITQAALRYSTLGQCVILIAPGVYSEDITITKPMTLTGYSSSSQQNLLTEIVGVVTIGLYGGGDALYTKVVEISNLQIAGSIIFQSSVNHTFNLENCRIASSGAVFTQTNDFTTNDFRIRMRNCTILQSATSADVNDMITFTCGTVSLDQLDVTARNVCSIVNFAGSSKLAVCGLCRFESSTSSASAPPIIKISITDPSAASIFPFFYNSFLYTSTTTKSNSPAILCSTVLDLQASGHAVVYITYNTFTIFGTISSNYVLSDANKADAANFAQVFFFSNSSGRSAILAALASVIDTTHKTTLPAVA